MLSPLLIPFLESDSNFHSMICEKYHPEIYRINLEMYTNDSVPE